jgi:hypothetical protein
MSALHAGRAARIQAGRDVMMTISSSACAASSLVACVTGIGVIT